MPLVMLCGYPCSGKTTLAEEIRTHLEGVGKTVVVISDHSLGVDRNSTYHRFVPSAHLSSFHDH